MKCSFRSTKMNLHRAASSLAGTIFSVKGKALVCSINEATHESHKLQKRVNLDASNKLSTEFLSPEWPEPTVKPSFFCGRRHFPIQPTRATDLLRDFTASLKKYVDSAIEAYEAEVVRFKSQIFSNWKFADKKKEKNRKKKKKKNLKGKGLRILEIGIGTGSNLHYYANGSDVEVIGIDPNPEMEKYARSSAASVGLPPSNFEFIQAVGENIPLSDASVDVVVGTFVLCSVKDVDLTLKEVMRVLRPGGRYMFMEHVAAKDGTFLKFIQRVLDRIERYSDGCQCHISRETGNNISKAGFSTVELNMAFLPRAFFLIPHAHGIAYK